MGDDAAASAELEALRQALRPEALRLADDPDGAEDLLQSTLELLLRHRGQLRDPRTVPAWCRTVMRNLRGQARRRERWLSGDTAIPDDAVDPWPLVDAELTFEALLGGLAAERRQVVRDFYLLGRTVACISRDQRRPQGTIKRWLYEAREALTVALSEQMDGPVARVHASSWLSDTEARVARALVAAGYRPEIRALGDDDWPAADTALFVLGEHAGCRSGIELLLAIRATEGMEQTPVLLFGPPRRTAILAAWQAGADAYLTDPSSPELPALLARLRGGEA